jgi:hypothetical protein
LKEITRILRSKKKAALFEIPGGFTVGVISAKKRERSSGSPNPKISTLAFKPLPGCS